ncbi:transposase [mine drainage metagenome]|uniref:Transposase n=1 Tax=mine drainage metagenome TaxID=410659 RepID=T0ZWR4_9ZZZZ
MQASVTAGRVQGKDTIGVRVGRIVNQHQVAKHFEFTIEDQRFEFKILEDQIAAEAALDGVSVIRTNVAKKQMSAFFARVAAAVLAICVALGYSIGARSP